MANVIHRTTLRYHASADPNDYPEPGWKHNPDMSAVAGVLNRYWKAPADWDAVGAGPLEMTQGEKDAVDAQIRTNARSAVVGRLDDVEDIQRAFMQVVVDGFNVLRAEHSLPPYTLAQLKTALQNKLGT